MLLRKSGCCCVCEAEHLTTEVTRVSSSLDTTPVCFRCLNVTAASGMAGRNQKNSKCDGRKKHLRPLS